MNYDYKAKKMVAIIAANVPPHIMTNIIGHLAVSAGNYINDDFMGRPFLADKSGTAHRGISKFPFITTKVRQVKLRAAIEAARAEGLFVADFPQEMLDTGHDNELAEAIASKEEKDFSYLGAVIYGDSKKVDAITGKFMLWQLDENAQPAESKTKKPKAERITDESKLLEFVGKAIAGNRKAVEDYKNGKETALGSLVGQCMRLSGGNGEPQIFNKLLKEKLS